MTYTETGGTRLHWNRSPSRREPGIARAESKCCRGRWRTSLTDCGWEVKEHEHVMPAISREPAAPSKLVDVFSCSCKAEGNYKSVVEGVAMDPMECRVLATVSAKEACFSVTHLLNRRRTKATHNRVKWILMNLRGREWLIELMTVDNSPVIWHTVVTIRCLLNYCHRLVC